MNNKLDKEYPIIEGNFEFAELTKKLVFGEDLYYKLTNRISTIQAIGRTGGLRIFSDFLSKFYSSSVHIPYPRNKQYFDIFSYSKFDVKTYPFYDYTNQNILKKEMNDYFNEIPDKSVILLNFSDNPIDFSLSNDELLDLSKIIIRKSHFIIFDFAYQGLITGDLDKDADVVRYFAKSNISMAVVQSFSKNMTLYGEKIGSLMILSENDTIANNIQQSLTIQVRTNYGMPPIYSKRLIICILSDQQLFDSWKKELIELYQKLKERKSKFRKEMLKLKIKIDKSLDNLNQLFFQITFNDDQIKKMREDYNINILKDRMINIGELRSNNMDYFSKALNGIYINN